MPVSKEAGAQVSEATVNLDGVLEVSVTRTVGDSTVARMIRLVTEAQATGGLFFDLPLPLAVIGHEGGTVLVVLNGLRLLSDPIRRSRPG